MTRPRCFSRIRAVLFWARKDAGAWTIPKGLVEAEGDLLATACREFNEETGFAVQGPFTALTPVKQSSGKVVHAWAFTGAFDPAQMSSNSFEMEWPPKSGRRQQFPEMDRVAWFGFATARGENPRLPAPAPA